MLRIWAHKVLSYLILIAVSLAWLVIIMGAYTRLTDAGLGCPDWPGCYGQLFLSTDTSNPPQGSEGSFSFSKAWTEMIHRYLAMSLGILILILAICLPKRSAMKRFCGWILGIVLFQALLGMWTVTWKLHPVVVMLHLMGGMTIFMFLNVLYQMRLNKHRMTINAASRLLFLGTVFLFLQISLGAWVSANYAALVCIGFPACNGLLWPEMDFSEIWSMPEVGNNYQGGFMQLKTRVGLHMLHRAGALCVAGYWIGLLWYLKHHTRNKWEYRTIWVIGMLLFLQITLGIINVTQGLPLWSAVLHNGIAALWLGVSAALCYRMSTYDY